MEKVSGLCFKKPNCIIYRISGLFDTINRISGLLDTNNRISSLLDTINPSVADPYHFYTDPDP